MVEGVGGWVGQPPHTCTRDTWTHMNICVHTHIHIPHSLATNNSLINKFGVSSHDNDSSKESKEFPMMMTLSANLSKTDCLEITQT